jgi:hypothetical protein
MPAAEGMTMPDKDVAADKATAMDATVKGRPGAKAAAMECGAAAAESAAMEATASMKAAATAAETAAATTAMTAAAAVAAADFDQSIGDVFRRQRHGARTCQRQCLRALCRCCCQHQQRRRRDTSRVNQKSPEIWNQT